MYKELVNGTFIQQDISYVSLMRRHIKKHPSFILFMKVIPINTGSFYAIRKLSQ